MLRLSNLGRLPETILDVRYMSVSPVSCLIDVLVLLLFLYFFICLISRILERQLKVVLESKPGKFRNQDDAELGLKECYKRFMDNEDLEKVRMNQIGVLCKGIRVTHWALLQMNYNFFGILHVMSLVKMPSPSINFYYDQHKYE